VEKIHKDFPIFVIKNFYRIYLNKNKIIQKVLENEYLFYCETLGKMTIKVFLTNYIKNFMIYVEKILYLHQQKSHQTNVGLM
jgi:hypothetical protein